MKTLIAIAAGGALGAVSRHLVGKWIGILFGTGFPWGILTVNVLGCVALGVLVEVMTLVWSPSIEMRAFLIVGFLSAFTTFSTFSLDVAVLHGRGEMLLAGGYIVGSVALSIGGFFAGMQLSRMVLQ